MDPNETLRQIRILVALLVDEVYPDRGFERGCELSIAVENLDNGLSNGGFPPDAWIQG